MDRTLTAPMQAARAQSELHASKAHAPNDRAIRRALETGGVEFIDENGGGPGVRLRKRIHKKLGNQGD